MITKEFLSSRSLLASEIEYNTDEDGNVDTEGNFCITETYETEVCYECYTELKEGS